MVLYELSYAFNLDETEEGRLYKHLFIIFYLAAEGIFLLLTKP